MSPDHLIGWLLLGTCALALMTGLVLMLPLPPTLLSKLNRSPFSIFSSLSNPKMNSAPEIIRESDSDPFYSFAVIRPKETVTEILGFMDALMQRPETPSHALPRLSSLCPEKYPLWPYRKGFEYKLIYDTKTYRTLLACLPAAPKEDDILRGADRYFRNTVIRDRDPCRAREMDLSLLHASCRLRLRRGMRLEYQKALNTNPSLPLQGKGDSWLAKVFPGRVFRAVFIELKRKRPRPWAPSFSRCPERQTFATPWDWDLFYSLKHATATDQDRDVFYRNVDDDLRRIARNQWVEHNGSDWLRRYFIACQQSGSLKALRLNNNMQNQALEWLEGIGRSLSSDDLLCELDNFCREQNEFIDSAFRKNHKAFYLGSGKLQVLARPEKLLHFTEWGDWHRKSTQEELDLQNIVYGLVERLWYEHMLSIEDIIKIQDVTDEDPEKEGSLKALRLLRALLQPS